MHVIPNTVHISMLNVMESQLIIARHCLGKFKNMPGEIKGEKGWEHLNGMIS